MRRVLIICLTLLSSMAFSESSSKATEVVTLGEAMAMGLQVHVDVSDHEVLGWNLYSSTYKLNFDKFKVCKPEFIRVRNFNKQHEILLDVKLERVGRWYEFSIGKGVEPLTSILAWCKSGDRNVYHISLVRE